jgi:hypothetical protein
MRPARIITAVVFAAAIAVTGCAAHSTAVNPPVTPVADAPAPVPVPAPKPIPLPVPAPKPPVLADGHYDTYISREPPVGRAQGVRCSPLKATPARVVGSDA